MITRRDFLKLAGLGTAAAAMFTACGPKNDTGSSSTTTDTASTDTAAATETSENSATNIQTVEATEEAEYSEFVIGTNNPWDTPTPWRSNTGNDAYVGKLVFEALGIQNDENVYVPWVAKSWTTNDNGFTYDFELYDYITDQNGNNITADDIVWFVETSKAKALKPNWANIDTIEKTGDYTFKITLTSNQVGVLDNFVFDTFIVAQKEVEASGDDFATSCVSTNAYTLTEFTSQVTMVFEKRADYWQTDASLIPASENPVVDKLTVNHISEASQLGISLESGDVDFAIALAASTAIQFEGNTDFSIQEYSKPNGIQCFFTGYDGMPCANDKYLRQAICYAIDTDAIIASCYQGYAGHMYDVANDKAYGYLAKWKDEEYYPYDVEKAKECLAQSDYAGQSLIILAGSSFKTIVEVMISNLEAVGIKSELLTGDMAWLTANRLDGSKYDMFINQVGCVSLAAQWSIRFDPAAYSTGDGTSRHDYELAEMLYKTWVLEGYTEENIDAVHNYIKENAYAYGMVDNHALNVWRADVNMIECVNDNCGCVRVEACHYAPRG